jgi:hypothetical protein
MKFQSRKRGPKRVVAEEPILKGRDKVGHGKRRRKRRPSRWMIGDCAFGDIRHVGRRNMGKKPKSK